MAMSTGGGGAAGKQQPRWQCVVGDTIARRGKRSVCFSILAFYFLFHLSIFYSAFLFSIPLFYFLFHFSFLFHSNPLYSTLFHSIPLFYISIPLFYFLFHLSIFYSTFLFSIPPFYASPNTMEGGAAENILSHAPSLK